MVRFLLLFISFPITFWSQPHQGTKSLKRVRFKSPVEVTIRLDKPIAGAEYRMIMEDNLAAHLDTLSFIGMLNHPGIYFAKLFNGPLTNSSNQEYYSTVPETKGTGLYPFNLQKINITKLEHPRGKFYMNTESAKEYRIWMVRKDPTDMGINYQVNTLPGVDSVRVIYVVKRKRW